MNFRKLDGTDSYSLILGCIAIGCRTDPECPLDRACQNRDCVNPCVTANPCGTNAECLVSQHLAQCRCIFGYTGDPYQACLPFEPPECVEDKDCPTDQVCINEKCINPCATLSPCVAPATCKLVSRYYSSILIQTRYLPTGCSNIKC